MKLGRQSLFAGFAMVVLGALLAVSYTNFQEPDESVRSTPSSAAVPQPTQPGPTVRCTAEEGPLSPMLSSDPCPDAIVAVNVAVAEVRQPLERIVIEPGPFYCNVIWPGIGSPSICFGFMVRAGQYMHAWVSFSDSDRVAAVMLGLDLPEDQDQPGATRPPWRTTLVAVEVPPAGWVMP